MNFKDKMKSGEMYLENDFPEELIHENIECLEKIYNFNQCRPSNLKEGMKILNSLFKELGKDCYILPPFHASWGENIHIGNRVYINYNGVMIDDADIYIGDDVMIGPNVVLATASHPISPELRKKTAEINKPIFIENGCWIGAGAIILQGVRIGENSIIGAGSIVTKDIPANVVAVGNPCKIIKKINEE